MAVINVEPIQGISYPVARKSLHSPLIVLFASQQCGLVIVGDDIYKAGQWATDWSYAYDTKGWAAVEVTISG
jgi:hypothetical protein